MTEERMAPQSPPIRYKAHPPSELSIQTHDTFSGSIASKQKGKQRTGNDSERNHAQETRKSDRSFTQFEEGEILDNKIGHEEVLLPNIIPDAVTPDTTKRFVRSKTGDEKAFLSALLRNDARMINEILAAKERKIDVNGTLPFKTSLGTTISYLMFASWFGFEETVEKLIRWGVDVNRRTKSRGITALHFAILANHPKVVHLLIRNYAKLNIRDSKTNATPIELAMSLCNLEMVEILMQQNIMEMEKKSPQAQQNFQAMGRNPESQHFSEDLFYMAQRDSRGLPMIILSYIDQGYDLEKLTIPLLQNHSYALDSTMNLNSRGIVFNPNLVYVNEKDSKGFTLLDHAARFGDLAGMIKLIKMQAESGKPDSLFRLASSSYPDCPGKLTFFTFLLSFKCLIRREQFGAEMKGDYNFSFVDPSTKQNPLHCLASSVYHDWKEYEKMQVDNKVSQKDFDKASRNIGELFMEIGISPEAGSREDYGDIKPYPYLSELFIDRCKLNINDKDKFDCTPLHYACKTGNAELVQYLINKGALVDIPNGEGWYPLHLAVKSRNVQVVTLLLTSITERNLLNCADDGRAVKGVRHVLHKLIVHTPSKNGCAVTPFILACGLSHKGEEREKFEILQIVKKIAAKDNKILNGCEPSGFNAFHAAARQNNVNVLKFLFQTVRSSGLVESEDAANMNLRNVLSLVVKTNLNTPLHYAAEKGNVEAVQKLILVNANPHQINRDNLRPIDLAVTNGHDRVVEVLKEFSKPDKRLRRKRQEMKRGHNSEDINSQQVMKIKDKLRGNQAHALKAL